MATNPRYKNGSLRRKHRQRFKAMGLPCHICGKPIRYEEPSDSKHPFSFVIDEIIPVSKYWLGGYGSAEEAAQDWQNVAPAHYICNQIKSNKINFLLKGSAPAKQMQQETKTQEPLRQQAEKQTHKPFALDGNW